MVGGPRLDLCPLAPSHARRLLAGDGRQAFVVGYPSDLVTEVLWLAAELPAESGAADHTLGPWLLTRQSDGAIVGVLRAARTEQPTAVTVGYEVAAGVRRRGYATEAVRALVGHLLGLPDVSRVCADTRIGNVASRRVLEEAGLRWERDAVDLVDGHPVTFAHYAVEQRRDRIGARTKAGETRP